MSKIRDSCHACAVSKVKCPKERPMCHRCEKRGIECTYFASKRPGRKREKPVDSSTSLSTDRGSRDRSKQSDLPAAAEKAAENSQAVNIADLSTPHPISPPASIGAGSGHFDDFSCFMDGFTGHGSHLDAIGQPKLSTVSGLFTDLLSEPLHAIDANSLRLDLAGFQHDRPDISDLLISNDVNTKSSSFRSPYITSERCTPFFHEQEHSITASDHTSNSSEIGSVCDCALRALSLLNRLFAAEPSPNESTPSRRQCSTPVSNAGPLGENLSTLNVVAQNKQSIEAVSNILQCSCSETGYLITMLSMIMFKIFEWYATAVRQIPTAMTLVRSESMFEGNWGIQPANEAVRKFRADFNSSEDDMSGRTTTQLILGELHHVQRLLNLLAQRLNTHGQGHALQQAMKAGVEDHLSPLLLTDHTRRNGTFSPSTLGQMEADLRRSLTTLSSEIITKLRQS